MATPTEHVSREVEFYLRGPVPNMLYCFGTVDAYRDALWHKGLITTFPAPSDNASDDFGIQQGGGWTVEIVDEMDDLDWPIEDENGDPILDEAGAALITEF